MIVATGAFLKVYFCEVPIQVIEKRFDQWLTELESQGINISYLENRESRDAMVNAVLASLGATFQYYWY